MAALAGTQRATPKTQKHATPPFMSKPSASRFGLHANLIMGGGPHMSTSVSSEGAGRWLVIISLEMKPAEKAQSSVGRSTVYHTLNCGWAVAQPSSISLQGATSRGAEQREP